MLNGLFRAEVRPHNEYVNCCASYLYCTLCRSTSLSYRGRRGRSPWPLVGV